jgi:polyisoprenoid-binding protein YceI
MRISQLLATLTLLTGTVVPAAAQQKLIATQSELTFAAKQMGVPINGHFKKFDAQLSFDAAKLSNSKVTFSVDMGSGTLGAPEMDSELPKAPWFNAAKFPQATFASSTFKALGAGKYEVAGQLTIKGQVRDVLVPLTLSQTGVITLASGVLPIKRLAFKVGDGDWADTSMVADDVLVKFKFSLSGIGKL